MRSLLLLCISFIIHTIFENALKLKNILVTKIISTLAHTHTYYVWCIYNYTYIKCEREKEAQLKRNSRRYAAAAAAADDDDDDDDGGR